MPGFVQRMVARWTLDEEGASKTVVTMTLNVDIATPFNLFMGPVMRLQLGGVLSRSLEELQHFAERGTPHPRKVRSVLKAQAQAA